MLKKLSALGMVGFLSIVMVACSGGNKEKPKEKTEMKTEQPSNANKTTESSSSDAKKK
ncbi:hypothetical protein II5_05871 [Bacillus cereus MSX-A1]|uniref:hypothetical protein n=1 Tax=Bacillus cereus TaxID=1396 RepID=UPI00027974A5|nr:hypothetical protein [Bacillus cereus]EJQ98094.1 hypothetical protein II5_05871 [Bacillus cereus MSX-A1]